MEENKKMEIFDVGGIICFIAIAYSGFYMDKFQGMWGVVICILAMSLGIFFFAMSGKKTDGV